MQGIGLRPAVYRLACEAGLAGSVQNRSGTVHLKLAGEAVAIDAFIRALPGRLPAHARLTSCKLAGECPAAAALPPFSILASEEDRVAEVSIPADLRMCDACREEILTEGNRRFGYAFTTCTNCGPRYTVVTGMPYDRERTTLREFPLCEACAAEYNDPADRRFHAESTACPSCGPEVWLHPSDGVGPVRRHAGALRTARALLRDGAVLGVRGLGGFLLAADATNRGALGALRRRKRRPDKPFAVLAWNLETVRRYCRLTAESAALLEGPEGPIVILDVNEHGRATLPMDLLTPDADTLGVMLPTTPLHELLIGPEGDAPAPAFEMLVMTSGNRRGEPICRTNEEALERLAGIADGFILHNRGIDLRADDSVVAVPPGGPQVWRRARGYAPAPVYLGAPLMRCTLALGAGLKNAPALGWDRKVVLSPHIGDLDTPEACAALEEAAGLFPRFLERDPECVAVDLHPDLFSTRLGERLARERGLRLVPVQHHHAHAAACLAENGRDEGLALVLDGTGFGDDGTVWGAELLHVDADGYRRFGTFVPSPLPGGDAAVRHPVRQLVARFVEAVGEIPTGWAARLGLTEEEVAVWTHQVTNNVNAPRSRGAGRVFDAVAVALGLMDGRTTYDGQPAVRLEACARRARETHGREWAPFDAGVEDGLMRVSWSDLFRRLALEGSGDRPAPELAMAFHRSVAAAAREMIHYGATRVRSRTVALTGGVLMNRILNGLLVPALREDGFDVLVHEVVPPNDGGVALGQAAIAGRTV